MRARDERKVAESVEARAKRHDKWLSSLKVNRPRSTEPVVIQLIADWGKTAKFLSEREVEVLQLISFGYSTLEIAEELCLSAHTITNHRKNMLTRSRCGNLTELVRVALNENLLL
jgi:DNA-binding NarL/FixJ family response regulator